MRNANSPYRYDRAEMRRVIETEGLDAAVARWPGDGANQLLRQIARMCGILPPWKKRHDRWKPELVQVLGTKSDAEIAAEHGISTSTVGQARRALGINIHRKDNAEIEADKAILAALTDEQLAGESASRVGAIYGVRVNLVRAETRRRGLRVIRQGGRNIDASLRMAAVAGMLAARPLVTDSDIAKIIHCTRERVRQLRGEITLVLTQAEMAEATP